MTALALAFIFGVGIAATGATQLKDLSDQGREIIQRLLVSIIIPLLPVYIAGVFAELAAAGTVFGTLRTFGVVLVMALVLHWAWILTLFTLAGIKAGKSPFALIRNMLPAYFTALGTMSSAATIPVSLQCSKNNGVAPDVADFTVPFRRDDDWRGAQQAIVESARKQCAPFLEEVRRYMNRISVTRGLEPPSVDPRVTLQVPVAGEIHLIVRVPAKSGQRGFIEQAIMSEVFQNNDYLPRLQAGAASPREEPSATDIPS
jgi:hypothetical protein